MTYLKSSLTWAISTASFWAGALVGQMPGGTGLDIQRPDSGRRETDWKVQEANPSQLPHEGPNTPTSTSMLALSRLPCA